MLQNGVIAVQKFFQTDYELDLDSMFDNKVNHLMRVKHKNIVRFLGYCSHTRRTVVNAKGNYVIAEDQQRFLCFEYVPRGSLDNYITGA